MTGDAMIWSQIPSKNSRSAACRAALLGLFFLLAQPAEAVAHRSDHPAAFRNNRQQFTYLRPVKPARMTPILAEDGGLLDLGRFRGRVILLNFWATWCPPCVRELPVLDRLQARLGGPGFTVVALSIDEGDVAGPAAFVRRLGLRNLTVYQDFTGTTAEAFPLYGLPITYLLDPRGNAVGYITGATDWDSPEVVRLIGHYVEGPESR
jgi:thiol-disulfide isomerase/thioredoxin